MIKNEIARPILEQQKMKIQLINNVEIKTKELIFNQATIYADNPTQTLEECFGLKTFECVRELIQEVV
jgi:hypothetical protein